MNHWIIGYIRYCRAGSFLGERCSVFTGRKYGDRKRVNVAALAMLVIDGRKLGVLEISGDELWREW